MILCLDNSIYTGITTDIERRFIEHKNGIGSNYTRSRGVSKIIYKEKCDSRSSALKREASIKSLKRTEKLTLANC